MSYSNVRRIVPAPSGSYEENIIPSDLEEIRKLEELMPSFDIVQTRRWQDYNSFLDRLLGNDYSSFDALSTGTQGYSDSGRVNKLLLLKALEENNKKNGNK